MSVLTDTFPKDTPELKDDGGDVKQGNEDLVATWNDSDFFESDESEEEDNEELRQMIAVLHMQQKKRRQKRRRAKLEWTGGSEKSFFETAVAVGEISMRAMQMFMAMDGKK
jgi:hypothetical protein